MDMPTEPTEPMEEEYRAWQEQNAPSSCTVDSLVRCPFCGEDDFDLIGLKSHLQHGECEPFENTELMSRVFVRAFNAVNSVLDRSDPPNSGGANGPVTGKYPEKGE